MKSADKWAAEIDEYGRTKDQVKAIRDEQRQGTRMTLRDTMQRIVDNHPLSCEFETDARYIWPKRWAAVEAAIPSAGEAPALKPGMLVIGRHPTSTVFEWTDERSSDEFRLCTKAECQAFKDKAPA